MRRIRLICAGAVCITMLSGCSSPFLPHNAVKYIPEFSCGRAAEPESAEDDESVQGGTTMNEGINGQHRSYFSPESIRERYDQHNSSLAADSSDPLLDIARETVDQIRLDGKTNEEIRTVLESKFHFDEKTINALLDE